MKVVRKVQEPEEKILKSKWNKCLVDSGERVGKLSKFVRPARVIKMAVRNIAGTIKSRYRKHVYNDSNKTNFISKHLASVLPPDGINKWH